MSKFHLRILTGISPFGVAFLLFILLISLFKSSTLKYLNENTFEITFCLQNSWIIFAFFKIPLALVWFLLIISVSKLSSFLVFNYLTMFLKKSLKVRATFDFSPKVSPFLKTVILELV